MSETLPACRREETVLCKPDDAPKEKTQAAAAVPTSECAMISEKQFMRDHTVYSAISSWLFAIAGATNIGLLSVVAAKVLSAVEKGQPLFTSNDPAKPAAFSNKKYNRVAGAMMVFGGACMVVSNWLESKKVVTEWQLGAGKLQRKANIAEKEADHAAQNTQAAAETNARADGKRWEDSVGERSGRVRA